MTRVHLLLGSNAGERERFLADATRALGKRVGKVRTASAIYETAAWGKTNQASFLNQVLELDSELNPRELLDCILSIETALGRVRLEKWAARTIDIDILFFGDEAMDEDDLRIPHPMIQARRFTLVPLAEIAPDLVHPVLHKTVSKLLAECPDTLEVKKIGDQ